MPKTKIRFQALGKSCSEVTQSMYLITAFQKNILLDFGLYQGVDIVESYKINAKRCGSMKPTKIDYIIISHSNIDHCGALPYLYAHGCTAPIYVAKGNKDIMYLMFCDSQKIFNSDCIRLNKQNHLQAKPLYTKQDIDKCMDYILERDFNSPFSLCNGIMCEFTSAHHIIAAAQIDLLFIDDKHCVKRIHYTGDIGSPYIDKQYVLPFVPPRQCDLLIAEATYAGEKRNHKPRDRAKDLEKITALVDKVCVEKKGKLIFPVFALDRLQTMLTVLFDLYGNDPTFDLPIYIDTPLGISLCEIWAQCISCDIAKWESVINWNAIKYVTSATQSMELQHSDQPMIVLASSGMCTHGRVVAWVKTALPKSEYHICFCGYSAEETIATKIKNSKRNKYLKIENKFYINRCGITVLNSFSSHACASELLDIYSNAKYERIVLVHGDYQNKLSFGKELQEVLSRNNRTSKVVVIGSDDGFYI